MQINNPNPSHAEAYWFFAKWAAGFILTGVTGYCFSPIRRWKAALNARMAQFDRMDALLRTVAHNHLHTIQDNTGETVKVLREMQLEQRELNGYIKGIAGR